MKAISSMATRHVLADLAALWPHRLRLMDNPQRAQAAALAAMVPMATGEVVVRADVHARYAPDYVRQCVAVGVATGADNVGGAVDDDLGRINLAVAAGFCIGALALGELVAREGVAPAEVIPVIDGKRHREDVRPVSDRAEERVGCRAGRAALAREKFDDAVDLGRRLFGLGRSGGDQADKRKQDRKQSPRHQ